VFTISNSSNVDLDNKKINFYNTAIDIIGSLIKDMSKMSNKEVVVMFDLMRRLMDKNENQVELSEEDMEFVRKYIGDIK